MLSFEQTRQHADYCRIPAQVIASIYSYVEHRQAPGHFLTAVLSNDLFATFGRADKESRSTLNDLITFIYMEVRSDCYGTPEKVKQWLNPVQQGCVKALIYKVGKNDAGKFEMWTSASPSKHYGLGTFDTVENARKELVQRHPKWKVEGPEQDCDTEIVVFKVTPQ